MHELPPNQESPEWLRLSELNRRITELCEDRKLLADGIMAHLQSPKDVPSKSELKGLLSIFHKKNNQERLKAWQDGTREYRRLQRTLVKVVTELRELFKERDDLEAKLFSEDRLNDIKKEHIESDEIAKETPFYTDISGLPPIDEETGEEIKN